MLFQRLQCIVIFGPPVILSPEDSSLLVRSDPKSRLKSDTDAWRLETTGIDPYLIISGNLKTQNPYISYFLPVAFALIALLFGPHLKKLISSSQLSKRYYLEDIGSKVPSSGKNFAALDGARGLAKFAIVIVLTYLTSAITYTYVERPFLKQGEN